MLMLISPTGTGYVNYWRGRRDRVPHPGRRRDGDHAVLETPVAAVARPDRCGARAEPAAAAAASWSACAPFRPSAGRRVVLFGESLGAHTSQDVLLHWGTLGPQALGIDRALWIGTPYGSKWMRQVTGAPRPDVDPDLVGVVNDFEQYMALPAERRARLRYVMVSHDNDGVTKFGPDLIVNRPRWLAPGRPAVQNVPGASPRGSQPGMRWRPLTTFLQTIIDMKNAQAAGAYRALAHDYRADLARFISEVYDLPALRRADGANRERARGPRRRRRAALRVVVDIAADRPIRVNDRRTQGSPVPVEAPDAAPAIVR